ncbi:MAG: hypothetical protein AB7O96_13815 [Pseudobdellovibrionaceae bacterium]
MLKILIASAFLISSLVHADDVVIDRDRVRNPEFGSTVVLKINKRTGEMKMIRTKDIVGSSREAKKLSKARAKSFKAVPKSKVRRSKSTQDFDTSGWYSWYYYYPSYYYSYPYYYGYNYGYYNYYQPYYYYSYGYYDYYYYGWYYYW